MFNFLQMRSIRSSASNCLAAKSVLLALLVVAATASANVEASKRGRLVVDTATLPAFDRSMTVFGFRLSGPRLNAPIFFESGSNDQWRSAPLDAGRYLLEQRTLPADWQFSDLDCGAKQVWSGVVIINEGETVRCKLTNKRAGRVVVRSRTQPDTSTADFDFSLINASGSARIATIAPDESANFVAPEGTYTLREKAQRGWATEITCQSGETGPLSRSIVVAPGQTVICTALNTYVQDAEPGISIDISPDEQVAVVNTSATFTVTVRNTGNIDLSNIAITNSEVAQCNRTIERLRAAAPPVVYTCALNGLQSGFTNRLAATTTEGAQAYASARVDLVNRLNPSVRVLVTANHSSVMSGEVVRFNVTVINTGNTPLTDIQLESPSALGCERTIAKIPVGNRTSFQCGRVAPAVSFTNVMTASASEGAIGSAVARVEVVAGKKTKH